MTSFQFTHPDKFDFSKPETWEKWFQRFERFRLASGLDGKDGDVQVNTLIYCMGSEADDILDSFSLTNAQKKEYRTVTEKLKEYFIPKRNTIYERSIFNQRTQQEGESVDSFVTHLYKLAENCAFGVLHDELIRDRLVVGLRDHKVSEKLQLDAELTLKKAITTARQHECIKKQQPVLRNQAAAQEESSLSAVKSKRHGQTNVFKTLKQPKQQTSKFKQYATNCKRCGRDSHKREDCPAKSTKCHKCGVKGHFARCCLSRPVESVDVESEGEYRKGFLGSIDVHDVDAAICEPWMTHVKLGNTELIFKVDTGADVTCISDKDFKKLRYRKLVKAKRTLRGPGNAQLNVIGKFDCEMESNKCFSVQEIYVIKGLSQALLGRPAIQGLQIISQVNLSAVHDTEQDSAAGYHYQFPNLFKGLGKTNWEYSITLDSNAKPYSLNVPRRVPIPLLEKVKAELQRMQDQGVISKVDEPTEWCAGMVVAPKSNSQIRICVDLTQLNQSIKREKHPLPTVEESLSKLAGGRVFSKIDANSGFWQIKLAEESKLLTTFITPFGRFCFNRLPFGISSAPEFYQKKMSELLEGIPGIVCQMDDCLISGSNQAEHDVRLKRVLNTVEQAGITLNKDKCVFSQPSVTFLGHIIGKRGIQVDPEKVRAITEMPRPENISDIRRFLGMANQLNRFSPNLAEETQPLRDLLRVKNTWAWGDAQENAFRKIKQLLGSTKVLAHYDPNKESLVSADASSFGIGGVLRQKHGGTWKPVAYASRSMSDAESRYAQIEKEALAITWACDRFSNYLIGSNFEIETDHKPLVPLLGMKDLSDMPPRIQRFKLRLMRFDFTVRHTAGKDLITADALSRAPVHQNSDSDLLLQSEAQAYVDMVTENLPASRSRLDQIRGAYSTDMLCSELLKYCKHGWPDKSALDKAMHSCWSERGDFTVQNGLLLKGSRLVIPSSLQSEILEKLHEGHQGISKCRERAKSSVWWTGLSKQLESVVKSCQICIEQTNNHAEPMIIAEFPKRPWQRVGSDLFELNGALYLLIVDYFSRYIEIAKLFGSGSGTVINHMKSIFARHGIPEVLVSDNATCYSSAQFREFSAKYGFKHVTSSPKYPQSNGLAERSVRTMKQMLKKADDPYLALLAYRTTLLHNGFSSSELLMGRKLQSTISIMPKSLQPKWPNMRK